MLLIFDENFPHDFVAAFERLEKADKHSTVKVSVCFVKDFMGRLGATDEEIIQKATKQNAVIVTHDSDFRRIKHYKQLLIEHQVGYIYFQVPKGKYLFWDIVKAFVNKWVELKTEISGSFPPFAIEINKHGHIKQLSF